MVKKVLATIVVLVVAMTILTGCATTYSAKSDQAISEGARWGTVGAITGALIGVAGQTNVGQAAAIGALALGLPAMTVEMLKPDQAPPAPVMVPVPAPVHLPGPKEVYISGWLEPEVKWEVVRELRALGYQVSEGYSVPLYLKMDQREIGDPRYITIAYLVDKISGRIIAQGKGEVSLHFITKERRLEAKKQAAIAAIRSLH